MKKLDPRFGMCGLSDETVLAIPRLHALIVGFGLGDDLNYADIFADLINEVTSRLDPANAAAPAAATALSSSDAERLAALEKAAEAFLNFEKAIASIQPGEQVKHLVDPTGILAGREFVMKLDMAAFQRLVDAYYVGRPRQ